MPKAAEIRILVVLFHFSSTFVETLNISFAAIETIRDSRMVTCDPDLYERVHHVSQNSWKVPVITNLDDYLAPLAAPKCLVVVDNFRKINLKIYSSPLILRRPVPICQTDYNTGYNKFKKALWGPGNLQFTNFSGSPDSVINCQLSKIFNGTGIFQDNSLPDACIRLNLRTLSKHTKPWMCEVHIILYPSFYSKEKFWEFWPSPFNVENSDTLYSYSYTPSVPRIHMLVRFSNFKEVHPLLLKQWLFEVLYPKGWVTPRRDINNLDSEQYVKKFRRTDILMQDIFLTLHVSPIKSHQLQFFLTEAGGFIKRVYNLKLIPGDWMKNETWKDLHTLIVMERIPNLSRIFKNKTSKATSSAMQNSDQNFLLNPHRAFLETGQTSLYYGIIEYLYSCGKFKEASEKLSLDRVENRISRELAKIWTKLLNNYTLIMRYASKRVHICTNGKESFVSGSQLKVIDILTVFSVGLQRAWYKNLLYYPPYFPSTGVNRNFRFLSCGTRTMSSLPFSELIKIFDKWIWLAIAITMVLTSVILATPTLINVTKMMNFSNHCLSQMKVLLEQSNPYSNELLTIKPLRWLLGSCLLVGMLLSSAYKNSNVYNLITPRKALPFETFEELQSENFTIFSPIGDIYVNDFFVRPTTTNIIVDSEGAGSALFLTGVSAYQVSVSSEFHIYRESIIQNNRTLQLTDALSMNPSILGWVKRIYDDISKINMSQSEYIRREMEIFKRQETPYFLKLMMKCEKIALILKSNVCTDTARKLKQKKYYLPVSVGREIYYGTNELLVMSGFVPRRIIKRQRGIGESGIWDWWMQVVIGSMSDPKAKLGSGNPPAQAASMGGNLMVVFCVWIAGLGVSTLYFSLVEFFCKWKMWKCGA